MSRKTNVKVIAYTLVCYDAEHSGVFNKILDQITYWKTKGYTVQIFVITDAKSKKFWTSIDQNAVILIDGNYFSKIFNRIKLVKLASQSNPSIIYSRDTFPLRIPRTSMPLIIEVQSFVSRELRMRSKLQYFFFHLLKKYFYSKVSGAIYVTKELRDLNEFKLPKSTPKIAIGNAINLKRIESLRNRSESQQALFFVGHPNQSWHGISEIIKFAKSNSDIYFHIVGYEGDSVGDNVKFYGTLNSADYREIAAKCIAGVGTLQLSVNKMSEASPLKVREYLALGLPVIIKYQDTDLDPELDYVLQLPSDGRALSEFALEVRAFLAQWSDKRVPRSQIWNLDVGKKEDIRLGFFESVLGSNKGMAIHREDRSESKD